MGAAIDLFRERGYHATGVDDSGQAVDVSGPAIYRHFTSKEEILVEAIRRAGDRIRVADDQARATATGPAELLEGYVRAYARVAVDESALMAVWTSEVRHLTPARRSPMTRRIRMWTDEWVELVRAWRPELDDDRARLLVVGAMGLITALSDRPHDDPRRLEDQLVAMALAALRTEL
ncbi:MAG: TetR/AcrR family transcriptional regulator [Acidimicrobiales bacterium]